MDDLRTTFRLRVATELQAGGWNAIAIEEAWHPSYFPHPDFIAISSGPSPIRLQVFFRRPENGKRLGAGTVKAITANSDFIAGWTVLITTHYPRTPNALRVARIASQEIPGLSLQLCSLEECLAFLRSHGAPTPSPDIKPSARAETHAIVLGAATPEMLEKLAKSRLSLEEALRCCNPRFFEELIAENWRAEGYDVELVRRLNAGGPDVVATKQDSVIPIRILTSCKWRSNQNAIKKLDIEELMAWVEMVYPANAGLLATNSYIQGGALELTQRFHRVQALSGEGVIEWTQKLWNRPRNSTVA